MFCSKPIQWYHSHADPIWPDCTFKETYRYLQYMTNLNTHKKNRAHKFLGIFVIRSGYGLGKNPGSRFSESHPDPKRFKVETTRYLLVLNDECSFCQPWKSATSCDSWVYTRQNHEKFRDFVYVKISVADPDPLDPHVFGPPGSGSTSQMYGSGSFYHHANIESKTLIPTILWLFLTLYLWKMM